MNKNTARRVNAARDAFGRCKAGHAGAADAAMAEQIGFKPRKSRHPKVGASGPEIAKHLGHNR